VITPHVSVGAARHEAAGEEATGLVTAPESVRPTAVLGMAVSAPPTIKVMIPGEYAPPLGRKRQTIARARNSKLKLIKGLRAGKSGVSM
jgi:hypothetical protein